MKKIIIAASLVLASLGASAEAYQVNLQSTRQTGMGHVGAALKLGSESMFFNPAGLSYMESTFDASLGGSGVISTINYTGSDDELTQTDNPISTPIYFNAAFKINDRLAAGVSVTNPYGSSLDWGYDWDGAELVQDISLQAFNIQPTLSYRINDQLSVGAGLMINFGSVSLSRAALPAGVLTAIMGSGYSDVVPAAVKLTGDSEVAFGVNIGLMYDINEKWTVGASYRSKVDLEIAEGDTEVSYTSEKIEYEFNQLSPTTVAAMSMLDNSTFSATMPLPANLTVGVAYKPIDDLVISADIQRVFWSSYESLEFVFSNYTDSFSEKNYKDTFIVRIGAQYRVFDYGEIRIGAYLDQSPIPSDYYSPETPGMDKYGLSAGLSYFVNDYLTVDLAFLYVYGAQRTGSVDYTSSYYGATSFSGTYSSESYIPSIGVSFKF